VILTAFVFPPAHDKKKTKAAILAALQKGSRAFGHTRFASPRVFQWT
jgi:hypothetical protein